MRFDIPRQRFYFFGHELWISEFGIVFFSMMFLMFLVAAMVDVLRTGLLRLSLPADDLQRSLAGARKHDSSAGQQILLDWKLRQRKLLCAGAVLR